MSILLKNCRVNWPEEICVFANVCGYCSSAIWFVVLFPQIWKNWKRRSVDGLSILWATANFTASLVNLFFVFYVSLPVYLQISAVYMPVLEFTILIQFWVYSKHSLDVKLCCGGLCVFVWATIITIELIVSDSTAKVQWVAIALWSVETFPQVFLNIRIRTTCGQSTPSAVIALTGKTTDFLANNLLKIPLQFVIMTYFSSSLAFINGIQVIWYPRPELKTNPNLQMPHGSDDDLMEEPLEANDCDETTLLGNLEESNERAVQQATEEGLAPIHNVTRSVHIECLPRFRSIPIYQMFLMGYVVLMLVVFAVTLCLNMNSLLGILAPAVVVGTLLAALFHRNHKEGRCPTLTRNGNYSQ